MGEKMKLGMKFYIHYTHFLLLHLRLTLCYIVLLFMLAPFLLLSDKHNKFPNNFAPGLHRHSTPSSWKGWSKISNLVQGHSRHWWCSPGKAHWCQVQRRESWDQGMWIGNIYKLSHTNGGGGGGVRSRYVWRVIFSK